MIWLAQEAVHTSGVNWESVAAIVTCVVVTMTALFGLFVKYVSTQITSAIDKLRIQVIESMEKRLSLLEYIVGIRKAKNDRQHDTPTG